LAAELGKTLLERNRELETSLKHHQAIIEDQGQEIEVSVRPLHRLAAELGKTLLERNRELETSLKHH
jgi:hypothetical protein